MNISGMNDYSSILRNYTVPSIPAHNPIAIEEMPRQDYAEKIPVTDIHEEPFAQVHPKTDAKLENISITFNKQDDFDFIGQDKDIRSLDMERAISDMKKDQVLQQYQYFVGSSKNILPAGSDGIVLAKF